MRVSTAMVVVLAVCSGCMPVAEPVPPGPGSSKADKPPAPGTPLAEVEIASGDRLSGNSRLAAVNRGAATRSVRAPASQPADVTDLADLAGGPSHGYIVGVVAGQLKGDVLDRAKHANEEAEQRPAQVGNVLPRVVADLNGDGFITLDEITAMNRAGLDATHLVQRLRDSHAIFAATLPQQQYLLDRGVPDAVVKFVAGPMPTTNPTTR